MRGRGQSRGPGLRGQSGLGGLMPSGRPRSHLVPPNQGPLNTGCPQHKVSRQSRAGVQRPREADKASRGRAWT